MALKKGDKAPCFTLGNTEKSQISLKDFESKNVVLFFSPMAFSGTCTTELCTMRDDFANNEKFQAEILAISVDSPISPDKFKSDQNLNFTFLSDFNKTASAAFCAIYDEFLLGLKGVYKRSAFLIDPKEYVQYAEIFDKATDLPNFVAVKETLATLN